MTGAPPTARIRALRDLEVDGVRIPEGAEAEIRRELLPGLVACGAAADDGALERLVTSVLKRQLEDDMPGHTEGEERLASVDPSAANDTAPAVVSSAEAITGTEAGPVSAEGKAGEAAGASTNDAAGSGIEPQPAAPAEGAVPVGEDPAPAAPPAAAPRRRR